jgi:hypothetical protein
MMHFLLTKRNLLMIRQKLRNVRMCANLVARSVDVGPQSKQSELDILEMFRVTELVITERLVEGIFTERKNDKKKKYIHLFKSIREQVLDSIRDVFINEQGRSSGLVLQKYNTLVLDALFELLSAVGPEESIRATKIVTQQCRRDIFNLGPIDEIDTIIASKTLAEMSRERARKTRRPLTKAQRIAAIDRAVQRLTEVSDD